MGLLGAGQGGSDMQAIRLKCKCGKVLRVPGTLAGKKVACPACKTNYRVPVAAATAAKPAAVTQSAPAAAKTGPDVSNAPSDMELSATSIAATPSELDLLSEIELVPSGPVCPGCKKQQPAGAKICVTCGIDLITGTSILKAPPNELASVSYAHRAVRGSKDAIGEPIRSYWADSLHSFIYPFKSLQNVVTLVAIMGIASLRVFLNYSILGGMGKFIIGGWLAACYLNIVTHTAMGIEELPGIKMEDGPWDDIIKPAFRYAGAYLFALAPAAAFLILLSTDILPDFMQSGVALLLWLAGGIFVWPMFVMLFAFEEWKQAYRVDLIITTIARAFLPYLSLWLILLVVGATSMLPIMFPFLDNAGIDLGLGFLVGEGLIGMIVFEALNVCLTVIAMRQIGLYYLHFKNRFTFCFE